jgi:Uma2 family endonuclease
MNILLQPRPATADAPQRFVFRDLTWQDYEKVLDVVGEAHIRVTFDRGNLELMTLSSLHEMYKSWFGRILDILAEELGFQLKGCGSTTMRREDVGRGLEPDECFYLAGTSRVRDWATLNLERDPPPDLAIEIEVSRSVLDRMGIYAALGVPELWRFDGETLRAYRLSEARTYELVPNSLAIPYLPLADIVPFLHRGVEVANDIEVMRAFRTWVRERVLPLSQAAGGSPSTETPGS